MNDLVKLGDREISVASLNNLVNLANAIEATSVKENGDLFVKFKKDVILEVPNNFAILVDGLHQL